MYNLVGTLTKCKFWNDLNEDEKILLLNNGNKKLIYRKGDVVEDYGGIIVISGILRAFVVTEEGKDVTLGYILPDDFDAFSSEKLSNLAELDIHFEAVEKSEICKIPISTIMVLKGNPKFEKYLEGILESRFKATVNALKSVVGKSLEVRIASCLTFYMEKKQSNILRITHEDVARCINSSREVVTKAMKHMAADGIVELQRGMIIIKDADRLKEIKGNTNCCC